MLQSIAISVYELIGMDHATEVQRTPVGRKGRVGRSMSKRRPKGPTYQRSITLPAHVWKLLDEVADLQSEAYLLMSGKTRFMVSDLIETGAELYLRDLIDEMGPLPKTAEERKAFVKRLAETNQRQLVEDLLGTKSKTH